MFSDKDIWFETDFLGEFLNWRPITAKDITCTLRCDAEIPKMCYGGGDICQDDICGGVLGNSQDLNH